MINLSGDNSNRIRDQSNMYSYNHQFYHHAYRTSPEIVAVLLTKYNTVLVLLELK